MGNEGSRQNSSLMNQPSEMASTELIPDESARRATGTSPLMMHMQHCRTEGFVLGSPQKDLRQRLAPTFGTKYAVLGQLEIKFGGEKSYLGTAQIFVLNNDEGQPDNSQRFILTCAHNFLVKDPESKALTHATQATFFLQREGEKSYSKKFAVTQWCMHPKYYADPDIYSGCDVAIGAIGKWPSDMHLGVLAHMAVWGPMKPEDVKRNKIEVAGYPGEKESIPYSMQGRISKCVTKGDSAYITYSDLDTTPGQSGSPVDLINAKGPAVTIAVHVGHDSFSNHNVATLVTPQIFEWINKAGRALKLG